MPVGVDMGRRPRPAGRGTAHRPSRVKGFSVILRLYGPLEPWFKEIWRSGEIEFVGSWSDGV